MRTLRVFLPLFALLLAGSSAFAQSLFFDFNGTNPFAHGFSQNNKGLSLVWSATSGITDTAVSGSDGAVISSGSSGKVSTAHNGSPTFSLNDGLSYTISEYVQINTTGTAGDILLGLALAQKNVLTGGTDVPLIGIGIENTDGTNLGVAAVWQDPGKHQASIRLTTQPFLGDWLQVTLTIQETGVAAGAFSYSVQVDDFGPTGIGQPVSLLAPTPGTFTDDLLGGKMASGWIPVWETTVPGNAFDNLAAGPSGGSGALIAAKGDQHHFGLHLGLGAHTLNTAGPAAVDAAGDVAVRVTATNPSDSVFTFGILLFSGTSVSLIAYNPVFTALSDPVLSGSGALAFIGTVQTGGSTGLTTAQGKGVFVYQSGTLNEVAQTGESAPIGSGNPFASLTFTGFSQIVVNNTGGISVLAGVKEFPGGNSTALFSTDSSGTLRLLTIKGQGGDQTAPSFSPFVPLPLVGGQSRTFDTVNGNGALLGQLNPPFAQTIGLALSDTDGFSESNQVETTGTVPNLPPVVTLKSLHEPIVNANATFAFEAVLTGSGINNGNDVGLGLVTSGTQGIFSRTGDPAPDSTGSATSGTFATISDPVLNNNDAFAFVATLKTSGTAITTRTAAGIWSSANGPIKRLVRSGDPAPGGGAFATFTQIVLPDVGDVIFTAALGNVPSGMNSGIYAVGSDGAITLVNRTGALIPVRAVMKTIKSLQIFQQPAEVVGQSRSFDASTATLIYQASFTDNTWAIYEVAFR